MFIISEKKENNAKFHDGVGILFLFGETWINHFILLFFRVKQFEKWTKRAITQIHRRYIAPPDNNNNKKKNGPVKSNLIKKKKKGSTS